MDKEEALKIFEDWYEKCLESGIIPEEIVQLVGEMALITDKDLIEYLQMKNLIK